jgi:hypothetical protein
MDTDNEGYDPLFGQIHVGEYPRTPAPGTTSTAGYFPSFLGMAAMPYILE